MWRRPVLHYQASRAGRMLTDTWRGGGVLGRELKVW